LGFCFSGGLAPQSFLEVRFRVLQIWTEIRTARFIVLGALTMFIGLASASARPVSTSDDTTTKPATSKTPASKTTASKTTAHVHHKKTAGSTVSSAGAAKSSGVAHPLAAGKRSSRKKPARARGQQKIDSERAQAIQEALIREHYLSGEATGTWNQSSEEAMRRYQADNGWQSKTVPDSRALIKLGLGPSKDHLLNPESAMTTVPDAPRAEPMPAASHTSAPTSDPAPPPDRSDSSRPQ
jgi:Putative peptidoglycan binding domain